jgi:hypothetical protein
MGAFASLSCVTKLKEKGEVMTEKQLREELEALLNKYREDNGVVVTRIYPEYNGRYELVDLSIETQKEGY